MNFLRSEVFFHTDPEIWGLGTQAHAAGNGHDLLEFERSEGSLVPLDDAIKLVLWTIDGDVVNGGLHYDWIFCFDGLLSDGQ